MADRPDPKHLRVIAVGSPINQLDRVVSTQILGAIILGKFLGDGLLLYFDSIFGRPDSLIIGAAVGLAFMLFWPSVERSYKRWQKRLWGDQNDIEG